MSTPSLLIQFASHQLSIAGAPAEVRDLVGRLYGQMLVPAPAHVAGEIEIIRRDGHYHVRGINDHIIQRRDTRSLAQKLKQEILQLLIRARPDLFWLHAAAVARDGQALLLCGAWGCGKSTLTAHLCRRGWSYLSDDIAPIDPAELQVLPFPQTPMMRVDAGGELLRAQVSDLQKVEVPLAPGSICRKPASVRAVVFPAFSPGTSARLEPFPQGDAVLELTRHSLNFTDHGGRALDHLARLTSGRPCLRLPFSNGALAARILDEDF